MACLNSHVLVYQASDPFQSAIWEKPLLTIHRLLLLHPCVLWLRNNFRLAQLPPWCGLFNVHNCRFIFLTSDNSEHVCPWLILHISWIFNFRSNYHEKKKKLRYWGDSCELDHCCCSYLLQLSSVVSFQVTVEFTYCPEQVYIFCCQCLVNKIKFWRGKISI